MSIPAVSFVLQQSETNTLDGGLQRKLNETVRLTEQQRKEAAEDPMYCIDAGSSGSVARFINHGCDYNLFVQPVLSSHHDLRLTRVVLVAAVPILPGTVSETPW